MKVPQNPLSHPISHLPRVGHDRNKQLARLGIHTLEDLLMHRPKRYEDRRQVRPIQSLTTTTEVATVQGRVLALGVKRFAGGRKSVFELILDDGTGRLHCRWWNLPYMQNYFKQGDEVIAYGKLNRLKPKTIDHPETEVLEGTDEDLVHLNRLAPVYPLTEGLSQRWLRALMFDIIRQHKSSVTEPWPLSLAPSWPTRANALAQIHFPDEFDQIETSRERLALDELVELQKLIQKRRRTLLANASSKECSGDNSLIKPFLAALGFTCTNSQTDVLREIRRDLQSGSPMRRLLQGDVGSGKTVVSAGATLMVLESGYNVILMVPTEILAEQHHKTFRRWFEPLGIDVDLQTASRKITSQPLQPSLPISTMKSRSERLIIGTHALIESSFLIEDLGLVIIDEQHRFGVAQREKLVKKGKYPHLLVMTATPIPRTLGLTVYGDLDISVINEKPAGRAPVKTFVRTGASQAKVWAFIRKKLEEGRQAYVVYPRIETEDNSTIKAVAKEWKAVKEEQKPYSVGLLHGGLSSEEKERVMMAFHENKIQILMTTTLIEVGVDVPNATIMLIENAEQFGLAQLHQLRGRIGRGQHESFCILMESRKTPDSSNRLKTLAATTDGFQIAEADLKLRGPGDLLGSEQSGWPKLVFTNLAKDLKLVECAREIAASISKKEEH